MSLTADESSRAGVIAEDPTIAGAEVYESEAPTREDCIIAIQCWERAAKEMRELLGLAPALDVAVEAALADLHAARPAPGMVLVKLEAALASHRGGAL